MVAPVPSLVLLWPKKPPQLVVPLVVTILPLNTQPSMVRWRPDGSDATNPLWVPSPLVLLLMVTLLTLLVMLAELCTMPTIPAAYLPSVLMVPLTVQPLTVSEPVLFDWLTRPAG